MSEGVSTGKAFRKADATSRSSQGNRRVPISDRLGNNPSGTKQTRGTITKTGNANRRRVLVEGTWQSGIILFRRVDVLRPALMRLEVRILALSMLRRWPS